MIEKKLWKLWCDSKQIPAGKDMDVKCTDKRITEQGVCVSVPKGFVQFSNTSTKVQKLNPSIPGSLICVGSLGAKLTYFYL